jgi:uncharacterized membrane protein
MMIINRKSSGKTKITIALVVGILLLSFGLISFAFPGYSAPTEGEWLNTSWHYRMRVEINTTVVNTTDWPLEFWVNFSDMVNDTGFVFDNNSVRVYEYNATGKMINEIVSQFDPELGYNNTVNAAGDVVFSLNGTTMPITKRIFYVYFDSLSNGAKQVPDYPINISYEWDANTGIVKVNNTLLDIRINTNGEENTSGIYHVEERVNFVPVVTVASGRTAEYIEYFNGTHNMSFLLGGNATIVRGPVRLTVIQQGDEVVFGSENRTGSARIVKKYHIYERAGQQSYGSFMKISQEIYFNQTVNRSSRSGAVALDLARTFLYPVIASHDGSSSDPHSWMEASDDFGVVGIINLNESVPNYFASYDSSLGRIGINFSNMEIPANTLISQESLLYFATGGSDGASEFLHVKNATINPLLVAENLTEKLAVSANPSVNRTVFNLNETILIRDNLSNGDPYNVVTLVNATLDMGTVSSADDINMTLYDDGTSGDEVSGDRIYTNNYTFPVDAAAGAWKITMKAYDNTGQVLNVTIFNFNVSNTYRVNITIFNSIGVINRQIIANVSVSTFDWTFGISEAVLNCSFNGIEVVNKIDNNNGNYTINFTAPGIQGTFDLSCNATKYNNTGTGTRSFLNEPPKTYVFMNATPNATAASTITMYLNDTKSILINLSNVGNGTAKNSNITVSLISGWSVNTTLENCGDIAVNGSCMRSFNITVPNNTAPGIYNISFIGSWTNPDDTQNFTIVNATFNITSNPVFNITEALVNGTGSDGVMKEIGYFTINSYGNSPAQNFTFNCTSGAACSGFNITFSPQNISVVPNATSTQISVSANITLGYSPGIYNGTINATSLSGSSVIDLFITVQNKTNISIITEPGNVTIAGLSIYTGASFNFTTNATNIWNSSARNVSLSYHAPGGWSVNVDSQSCGNLVWNSTCRRNSTVTIPNSTSDGNYTVNITVNWTNLDGTSEMKNYTLNIIIVSSPLLDVINGSLYGTVYAGQTLNPFNLTVISVGNSPVTGIAFNCTSGDVCGNFTFAFNPVNIPSLIVAANATVEIDITVPANFSAGIYTGVLNVTSANDGNQLVGLTVIVAPARSWTMSPEICQRSLVIDEGLACNVNITNTGNDIINFTVLTVVSNKTQPNVTNFSVSQGQSYLLAMMYNITGFNQSIYNSTYIVSALQESTPQNRTLNITLLPAIPPNITIEFRHPMDEQDSTMIIRANITDVTNMGIIIVNVTVTMPNGTTEVANMSLVNINGSHSVWEAAYPNTTLVDVTMFDNETNTTYNIQVNKTFGNTTARGVYNVTVRAEDTIGNRGNSSSNFAIRMKLNIAARTLGSAYLQGDTATVYYTVRDIQNLAVQDVNASFWVYDPNNTLIYHTNKLTDSLGSFNPLPVFSMASDIITGTYTLYSSTSFNDTLLNLPFTINNTYNFIVEEKTVVVNGLFADVETAVVWFPNNVMRFNVLVYDGEGVPVDPATINLTVYDPAQNVYFSIPLSSMTKRGVGFYAYNYAMPPSSATGMYLAVVNLTRSTMSTMKLKAFRVAAGGPYDVRLNLVKHEVAQGEPLDFTITVENKGEVTQDVFMNYTVVNTATGAVYYTSSEAVLTPAFANQSFSRSAFIYSSQPLGSYLLRAVVRYDNSQPDINASSSFAVIVGRNLTKPPEPEKKGPAGYGPPITGVVTEPAQVVRSITIEKYSDTINTYPGFKKIEYVVVRNSGKTGLTDISMSIVGIPAAWYNISPSIYRLLDQDNSTVFLVEYNIPKDAAVGTYKFNLVVSTSTTSDQKAVVLNILGSVSDLITSEIAQLRKSLNDLLVDIGAARSQGKNVNDVLAITVQIEDDINNAQTNYGMNNTQTALENIKDAKIMIERARDLLSRLLVVRVEGQLDILIILAALMPVIIIIVLVVLKKKNAMPKHLSDTIAMFGGIIEKIRSSKTPVETINKEKEKLARMLSVLENEKKEGMMTDSAYAEMRKSVEAKLARIDKKK